MCRRDSWQGMNWIHPTTRLAIYLRDGLACVYCRSSLTDGAERLELDHVIPASKNGSNKPKNLVTACSKCNRSRSDRPVAKFVRAVAEYLDWSEKEIADHIRKCRRRKLPRKQALAMLKRKGSVSKAVNS